MWTCEVIDLQLWLYVCWIYSNLHTCYVKNHTAWECWESSFQYDSSQWSPALTLGCLLQVAPELVLSPTCHDSSDCVRRYCCALSLSNMVNAFIDDCAERESCWLMWGMHRGCISHGVAPYIRQRYIDCNSRVDGGIILSFRVTMFRVTASGVTSGAIALVCIVPVYQHGCPMGIHY